MPSILSSLWGSTETQGERRSSTDDVTKSSANKVQHAVHAGNVKNVWESVFNPGRNMNLAKAPASYYDKPEGSKATTWDHVLKADNVRRLTFAGLDKNADGYITADELRAELSGSSADVNAMIKQADKNGDGKIDFAEFSDLFRNSPSA